MGPYQSGPQPPNREIDIQKFGPSGCGTPPGPIASWTARYFDRMVGVTGFAPRATRAGRRLKTSRLLGIWDLDLGIWDLEKWSGRLDSNQRPPAPKASWAYSSKC